MIDAISLGEILIDFTPAGRCANGNPLFECNPGGAPANVAVQLARLGLASAFLGKVGKDEFGRFLKRTLDSYGVDTSGLRTDEKVATTLAFVQLSESGDRSFSFYRNPGADTQLYEDDVDYKQIDDCRLLHFGSLLFVREPARSTSLKILEYAKNQGKLISYDPNWRPALWESEQQGLGEIRNGLQFCDIVKVSKQELTLITGCDDISGGIHRLLESGIRIAVVTLGAEGCVVSSQKGTVCRRTYDTKVTDTTGSGDSFFAAFLYRILKSGKAPDEISIEELSDFADFSNAAGATCATRTGAIPALPDLAQIEWCIKNIPLL